MTDTPAQPDRRAAQEAWNKSQPNHYAVRDFTVYPADPVTSKEFNAAVLVVTTGRGFVGDSSTQMALAFSERELLGLADEIRRKLRPTSVDRLLDALDGIGDRLDALGS